jgi:hypothetical protein
VARNSLAASKAELYALLSGANLPAGVVAAYDHEPLPGQMAKPVALTVSTAGMDPDFYLLAVRIYQTAEVDAQTAQANLDTLILVVEHKLTDGFGMAPWSVAYHPELDALVATCVLPVGRED